MERFEFDNRKERGYANANRKNGSTIHGVIEIYPNFVSDKLLSLDIRGPAGAERGSAHIDKATAWKLGFALLKWSGSEAAALAASGIYAPYCSALAALVAALLALPLEPGKYYLFDGELRHNKTVGVRQKIVLYDVFIFGDELFFARHKAESLLVAVPKLPNTGR